MISLQPFTSRPDSLRVQWANQRWEHGIQPFFLDHVPFSLRNGPTYADHLVSVYESLAREKFSGHAGPLEVIEFGAGLGYLSYHFMCRLRERFPELYDKTVLHVTDSGEDIVASYQKIALFDSFGDQVRPAVLDATTVKLDFSPVFAFSTYLLDSFPAYSLAYVDQTLMEIQVESFCESGTTLVDLEKSELKGYSNVALATVLTDPQPIWDRLLSQAIAFLEEGFRVAPYALTDDQLGSDLVAQLTKYLSAVHDQPETLKFNVSQAIFTHLSSVYESLAPGGIYVVSDFGFSESLNDVEMPLLSATYGLSCYMMVAFPLYDWVLKSLGAQTWRTNRESDQTQEWVIQKDNTLLPGVQDQFEPPKVTVSEVLDQLVTLPNDDTYLSSISAQLATLPPSEQKDYFLLTTLMAQLLDDGFPEESERYLQQLSESYGDACFDAHRMRGFFAQNKEDHAVAIQSFESALGLCPHDAMSHAACSMSHLIQGDFDLAIPHLKQAFQYSAGDGRWQHLMGLLLAYKYSGQLEVIQDIQSDLEALHSSGAVLFPEGVYYRLRAI